MITDRNYDSDVQFNCVNEWVFLSSTALNLYHHGLITYREKDFLRNIRRYFWLSERQYKWAQDIFLRVTHW
jgi:hypothetical protein